MSRICRKARRAISAKPLPKSTTLFTKTKTPRTLPRAAAFGSKVVIMDEPTAALGVKESRRVLELILDVRSRGLPIVLISHNMPHVFEVADRIHVHRLGKRLCVINPKEHTMSDAVAFMTGAKEPPREALAA
jgi:fructose transport system ATP-binding protein